MEGNVRCILPGNFGVCLFVCLESNGQFVWGGGSSWRVLFKGSVRCILPGNSGVYLGFKVNVCVGGWGCANIWQLVFYVEDFFGLLCGIECEVSAVCITGELLNIFFPTVQKRKK